MCIRHIFNAAMFSVLLISYTVHNGNEKKRPHHPMNKSTILRTLVLYFTEVYSCHGVFKTAS